MKLKTKLLDVIYPRCCPVCHDIVVPKGELICRKCILKVQPIREPRCMKCGKSLNQMERELCGDCERRVHQYDQGIGIYPYNEMMRVSMEYYKFHGRREYGDFYVQAMAHYGQTHIRRWKPECIIPIPMLPEKERIRGFNQSAYLASGLSRILGIPICPKDVRRVQGGKAQKELNAKERRRNLKRAFQIGKEYIPHESVLLVDDVYTTGSTIDAVAELLKRNGTHRVYFITVCQGKGF